MRLLELFFFAAFLSFSARALSTDSSDAALGTDAWSDQVLSSHNAARAQYGARPVSWNGALYPGALQWAQACRFTPSNGNYGENFIASSDPAFNINKAVAIWMQEASKYDYHRPGFSPATGHFTQVVWKSTTQVACAIADCPAGTIFPQPSKFIVCRYTPPGNVPGQFPQNVGRPV